LESRRASAQRELQMAHVAAGFPAGYSGEGSAGARGPVLGNSGARSLPLQKWARVRTALEKKGGELCKGAGG